MRYVLILLLLCSCSATRLLQRSEKLKLLAIAKGAKVRIDTVYKIVKEYIEIPAFTDSASIEALRDDGLFNRVMYQYDSLRARQVLTVGRNIELKQKIAKQRDLIARGFLRDSLYHIQFNRDTRVDLAIVNGSPRLIKVDVKPRTIMVEKRIPIAVNENVSAGYTLWQMIGAGFAGVILAGVCIGSWLWIKLQRQEKSRSSV